MILESIFNGDCSPLSAGADSRAAAAAATCRQVKDVELKNSMIDCKSIVMDRCDVK